MLKQPYKAISFDWLEKNLYSNADMHPEENDVELSEYLMPNGFGHGKIQTLKLALGMTMFHAANYFEPAATGQSIPVGEVKVELNAPTFQAQILRGGRVLETQIYPQGNLLLSPGIDLFRYSSRYHIAPSLDGSSNSEMTCLSVDRTMLENLIGLSDTEALLMFLGLTDFPQVVAKSIPLHVSAHLHKSINQSLSGAARKLFCQARALDYLTALVEHMKSTLVSSKLPAIRASKKRSQDVHEFLMGIEGKLPTLDILAIQFGCSARLLNEDFIEEYGESIYSFITNQRLLAAHEAIQNSDLALKVLAARLGYTHVNHFITAFRKKFGYPPGSLRKNPRLPD